MSSNSVLLLVLGGCVLLAAGAFGLILWRIGRLKRAVSVARSWPVVPGRVVATRIDVLSISLPRDRGVSYGAIVEYEYEIAGERWRSHRYSLSGPHYTSFERSARRILARYPVGSAVAVSYDPAVPQGGGVIALDAPLIRTLRIVFWICLLLFAWLLGGMFLFEPVFGSQPLIRL